MTGIDSMLHPTFEALSAHADAAHDVASASRVGRHVARCERCRAEVAEIRALGEAARAVEVSGPPTDLWSRIERAAAGPRPASARVVSMGTVADGPMPMARRHRGLAAAALVIGAALAAVALWPQPASLQAAGPSRLSFTPARPIPGGVVTVRYVPPTSMSDASRLVLLGRFARPAGQYPPPVGGRVVAELADSLGELVRSTDGAYAGTIRLPANFLAVSLAVREPRADRLDLDGFAPWLVIGGTPAGGPSLRSLLAAIDTRALPFGPGPSLRTRQPVDVADSLKRYFPRHPAGWAYTRSYGLARGRFDFLRFFETAERRYASLDHTLWPQPALDADQLHAMVVFARRIDEPTEMLRWAGRFAKEHPEDPRALTALVDAVHEIELRPVPALSDSVRRWLPAIDSAYRRTPLPNVAYTDARRLAVLYGDSATAARWRVRALENGVVDNIWLMARPAPGDAGAVVVAELRRRATSPCELPAGRFPLASSVGRWRSHCELYRGIAFSFLSSAALDDGRPRQALAEADSALATMRLGGHCVSPRGYLAHALASLAVGDTVTAESDFIGAAVDPARAEQTLDTARSRLGARFDRATVMVRLDSARRDAQACVDRGRAR
ncbi:MAG: hypothetical protein HOQ14_14530 [Gemmatimonadaceae bacterium]|nr:hypothetical protein [Gemmatimonadaceae bacterium]